jgi:hypothetical protein
MAAQEEMQGAAAQEVVGVPEAKPMASGSTAALHPFSMGTGYLTFCPARVGVAAAGSMAQPEGMGVQGAIIQMDQAVRAVRGVPAAWPAPVEMDPAVDGPQAFICTTYKIR